MKTTKEQFETAGFAFPTTPKVSREHRVARARVNAAMREEIQRREFERQASRDAAKNAFEYARSMGA